MQCPTQETLLHQVTHPGTMCTYITIGTLGAKTGHHFGSSSGLYIPDPRGETSIAHMDET